MGRRLLSLVAAFVMLASGMVPAGAWAAAIERGAACADRAPASRPACEGDADSCCCGTGGSCCVERPAAPAPRPDADTPPRERAPTASFAPALLAAALCATTDLLGLPAASLVRDATDAGAARGFAGSPSERRLHLRHAVFLA